MCEKFSGSVVTENQKKPPPCPLREGECCDGKGEGIIRELAYLEMRKWGGVGSERLKRGEPKTKRAILTLAKFETLPKYSDNKHLSNSL